MQESWLIVFAPESSFPDDGDFDRLPAFATERVSKALELCPISPLGSLPPEGVRYLHFDEVEDLLLVAKTAEILSRALGPVTILDEQYITICGVKAGDSAEQVAEELVARAPKALAGSCQECGERLSAQSLRCPTCGWSPGSGRRPSLQPPAFAPGRPPRTSPLPPLKNVLWITLILGLLGVPAALHRGVLGMLGCDAAGPPVAPVPPEVANTSGAMAIGQLLLETAKSEFSPEGWIVVTQAPPIGGSAFRKQPDGRIVLCDGWNRPIRCSRLRDQVRFHSWGPDGKDDQGKGDDIVQTMTLR